MFQCVYYRLQYKKRRVQMFSIMVVVNAHNSLQFEYLINIL